MSYYIYIIGFTKVNIDYITTYMNYIGISNGLKIIISISRIIFILFMIIVLCFIYNFKVKHIHMQMKMKINTRTYINIKTYCYSG